MRQRQRRDSARAWIGSGATVTVKAYAKRYGVDRYTASDDLTALGFQLPSAAQQWAHRPPSTPRPRRQHRPVHGKTITSEGTLAGPSATAGSVYVFEADDMSAAIEFASRIPAARLGGAIEVRPVGQYW
jgi:hypothetical protein